MSLKSLKNLALKIRVLGEEQRCLKKTLFSLDQTLRDDEFTTLAKKHNAVVLKKAELINQYNHFTKRNIRVGAFKQISF